MRSGDMGGKSPHQMFHSRDGNSATVPSDPEDDYGVDPIPTRRRSRRGAAKLTKLW